MSWETSTYVLGQKVGSAAAKLVLLGYANHAHADGTSAFPGIKRIASYAECSERTVQRHVAALIAEGWMREGDQQLVAHFPEGQRPIVYDMAMTAEQREEWKVVHATGGNARRDRATVIGSKGGKASAQARAGDKMSPAQVASNGEVTGGDKVSPAGCGDIGDTTPVTNQAGGGDTGVTQTTQQPPLEANHPSSSLAEAADDGPTAPADAVAETNETKPKATTKRGTRLPEPFEVSEDMKLWVVQNAPHVKAWDQHERFCDYWRGVPGQRGVKLDWVGTWRNWMRKAEDDAAPGRHAGGRAAYDDRRTWGDYDPDAATAAQSPEEVAAIFGTTGTNG